MLLNPGLKKRLIDVLEEWLNAIWDGTANDRLPSADYEADINPDDADTLISEIMDWYNEEFDLNRRYWNGKGIYEIPDFTQIKGKSRLAFVQDLRRTIKAFT
jgi:hypothetical protein